MKLAGENSNLIFSFLVRKKILKSCGKKMVGHEFNQYYADWIGLGEKNVYVKRNIRNYTYEVFVKDYDNYDIYNKYEIIPRNKRAKNSMLSIKEKRKYLLDLYDSFGFKDDAPVVLEFQYRDADVVNDMYNFVKKYEGKLNHSRFKLASSWYYNRKYRPELVVDPENDEWEFDSDGNMIVYVDGERVLM